MRADTGSQQDLSNVTQSSHLSQVVLTFLLRYSIGVCGYCLQNFPQTISTLYVNGKLTSNIAIVGPPPGVGIIVVVMVQYVWTWCSVYCRGSEAAMTKNWAWWLREKGQLTPLFAANAMLINESWFSVSKERFGRFDQSKWLKGSGMKWRSFTTVYVNCMLLKWQ